FLDKAIPTGTGYTAKYICTQVFVMNRDPEIVYQNDVKPTHPLFSIVNYKVNKEENTVETDAFGFWNKRTALYRNPAGCTLVRGINLDEFKKETYEILTLPPKFTSEEWPNGELVNPVTIPEGLENIIIDSFKEPGNTKTPRNTHAVVIVKDGKIILERYHKDFSPSKPILGWSMSKTITGILIGILARDKMISISEPAPIPLWRNSKDERKSITVEHLLTMTDGLDFEEEYGPGTDATIMLYESKSMADFVIGKNSKHTPGRIFNYSSGTTNILSKIVKERSKVVFNNPDHFMKRELFEKLNIKSIVFETDSSNTFVGSSYANASARDWARIGLLILNKGEWNGQTIYTKEYSEKMITPSPAAEKGEYGYQIWLNKGKNGNKYFPKLTEELIFLHGYNGQIVAILPSKNLIIVRLGATPSNKKAWDEEIFLKDIIELF
ncbi:MAG: serine hydrolase, partial [Leptospiraceae bacterium]|nr:serine hydrolase [Leptospiraceae bacterium]